MAVCSKCGLQLSFHKLPSGKFRPVNPDGSDHWDVCREIRYAKAKRGEKVRIKEPGGAYTEAWISPEGDKFYITKSSGWITGSRYRPIIHSCGLPAWEDCHCSRAEVSQQVSP